MRLLPHGQRHSYLPFYFGCWCRTVIALLFCTFCLKLVQSPSSDEDLIFNNQVDEKEEDLFAGLIARSPTKANEEASMLSNNNRPLRSSFVSSPPLRNEAFITASPRQIERFERLKITEDFAGEDGVEERHDFRRPSRLTSAIVSPNSNRKSIIDIVTPSPLTSPTMAQVRPCGLTRRTSFRYYHWKLNKL